MPICEPLLRGDVNSSRRAAGAESAQNEMLDHVRYKRGAGRTRLIPDATAKDSTLTNEVRRLSPDSNPIDIQTRPKHSDEEVLLTAMGCEAANVHLGTKSQTKKILKDLKVRKQGWLQDAAVRMAKMMEKDWKRYRKP